MSLSTQGFSIELGNLSKSFNNRILFSEISEHLKAGEKWAILGQNGSGKSTLSLILAGQVLPTTGTCKWKLNETEIKPEQVYAYYALASPSLELIEDFTLEEIFKFHFSLKKPLIEAPFETTVALCNFKKENLVAPLGNFSSGMKQRVKLCLAFFSRVEMLLLDEPLTNLDDKGIKLYQKLVQEYSSNRLIVVASNREDEYGFCDKKIWVDQAMQAS